MPTYQDADESDVFILSGSEDLAPVLVEEAGQWVAPTEVRVVQGASYQIRRYRPRVEGSFARIERWTNEAAPSDTFWRSITRDNVTTFYGKTDESRICDPGDPRRIFSWLICESYDDKGNAIVYEYAAEDSSGVDPSQANEKNRTTAGRSANRYLKRIKYGNQSSRLVEPNLSAAIWLFELVFDYDEGHARPLPPDAESRQFVLASKEAGQPWSVRQDAFSSHRAGYEVRTYRLCRSVLMFHHFPDELGTDDYLVRSTEFTYDESPLASFIKSVTQSGYVRRDDGSYLKKSLPPLELEYTRVTVQDEVREVDAESLENLPVGVDGAQYQWLDLDGEGLSGILSEQAGAWFYKPNLGEGHFGSLQKLAALPVIQSSTGQRHQFLDLAGDGQLDIVQFSGPVPGFYERTDEGGWQPFTAFSSLPNLEWNDPNLRFVDLTGDGRADILVTEDNVLAWLPSLGEEGFSSFTRLRQALDEEKGPKQVFADGTQSLYLADMSGDGLADLVRVRNGEVCYWSNLGYGRFGAKVTMDGAPRFDNPDQFDQRRIRLADIDGSGTSDIIYLGRDQVSLYFNQSGNSWSAPRHLSQFPQVDDLSSVMTLDLLGNGTACLVWSSPLPHDARRPLRYIDLMGGQKPHLLIRSLNNLGSETRVTYAPSTKFYIADKLAGRPWITRIPFPAHVVERIEIYDHVSGNRFVTRYAYHHGYFDGVEREFRGFGMVEQFDTEEFAALSASQAFPTGTNVEASSHVPPVLTRTWFHTGVYLNRDHISDFYAGLLNGTDAGEYYREPGLSDAQARALLLDDTPLPNGLTVEEEREACRALKGSMLRQEVYALDGTAKERYPYTVIEQNFTIRRLQPKAENRYAVFFAHPRESISYHYEREPADPRVAHTLTLEVDDFGNILKSAVVSYGRYYPDTALESQDQSRQAEVLITYNENGFTNSIQADDDYRTPLPSETRTYELTGYIPSGTSGRFQISDFVQPGTSGLTLIFDAEINYEVRPSSGKQRRLIKHTRTYYRPNDLGASQGDSLALLPLGVVESLALPGETYRLAFTKGLVALVYGGRVTDAMLTDEGRYVHSEGDANWWMPSGRVFYSSDAADSPAQELAQAQAHFFLPRRYRDPFHSSLVSTETLVTYDSFDLLVQETRDALGNRATVGERDIDPTQPLVRRGQDYRVLQPALVMDANRNRSAVAFDAIGLVVGTAVMGKPEEMPIPGDQLATTFQADLTQAQLDQFFADPKGAITATLLGTATTRIIYDLTRYWREPDPQKKPPAFAATLARETHASEPVPAGGLRIQVSFSYSDGFGREIQKKLQAEAGPAPLRDGAGHIITADGEPQMTLDDISPLWVGTGWTVFNNKGKPVRQYEPFFTDTHDFEFDVRIGVSPVIFYDPAERVVATLHPDHTWDKVVFNAWKQETWDVSDTVLAGDPKNDPDAGDFFRRLPDADYLPTWYTARQGGTLGSEEEAAAAKAAIHAQTPTVAHLDALGRAFLKIDHNRFKHSDAPPADSPTEEFYNTRVIFDIEGNEREVIDANDRAVMRYDYNLTEPDKDQNKDKDQEKANHRIHQASMEAGERWTLSDVAGKPARAWDSRGHHFRTTYDALQRHAESYLSEGAGPELLIERFVYGETQADPEASNLRGKIAQRFDQAGVITSDLYDFKGNLLRTRHQLAQEYKTALDWSSAVPMEATLYTSSSRYDALNRLNESTEPDKSVIHITYNDANLIERVEANLRGDAVATPFVTNIDYDAKGQRTLIRYGNGVETAYAYDPLTFRLINLLTRRDSVVFPDDCPQPPAAGWPGCAVQNLHYTYDPIGNITHIRDEAQQAVYFRNRRVEPSAEYTYDAIYRLIEATGREHLGQTGGLLNPPTVPDAFSGFHSRLDHPGDGKAMGTYIERYLYDAVGNILAMQHRGSDPAHTDWTRAYAYNEASQLEAGKVNNRLSNTRVATVTESYRYDGPAGLHGNITAMPHLPLMQWDYRDQLQATAQQVVNSGTPETTWYVYDSNGQRVRKVTERQAAAGVTPTRMKERIYFAGFEVYREYESDGSTVKLERETLHVMDDKQRVALVETRTEGDDPAPVQLTRYQHGNHLGSASLELDDAAQIISYEEYFPYGSTSYQAVRSQTETPKRYRYTGKERDEESGLYYHGARYYAAWLGRWISADPAGLVDGPCLYEYGKNNPAIFSDSLGLQAEDDSNPPTSLKFEADFVKKYNAAIDDVFSKLEAREFKDIVEAPGDLENQFAEFPLTEKEISRKGYRYQQYQELQEYKKYVELNSLLKLSESKSVGDLSRISSLLFSLEDNNTNKELRVLAYGLSLFISGSKKYNIVDISSLDDYAAIQFDKGVTIKGKESIYKSDLMNKNTYGASTLSTTSNPSLDYIFINNEDASQKNLLILSSLISATVGNIRGSDANFGLTTNQILNSFYSLLGKSAQSYSGTVNGRYENSLEPYSTQEIPEEIRYKQINYTYTVKTYDLYKGRFIK